MSQHEYEIEILCKGGEKFSTTVHNDTGMSDACETAFVGATCRHQYPVCITWVQGNGWAIDYDPKPFPCREHDYSLFRVADQPSRLCGTYDSLQAAIDAADAAGRADYYRKRGSKP